MPSSVASQLNVSAPARIGFLTSCGIVVANIIGTGVFTSLGFQVVELRSGFVLLALWIVGGIVALCGALCYGELAAALPRSGGEYHLLSAIYHPALGFMAGFVSATVGFAAPIALAAMAFGKYAEGIFGHGSALALSFALVWVNGLVHLRGTRTGSVFQDFFTLLKIVLIAVLIGAGLLAESRQPISFRPVGGDLAASLSPAFAVALVFVMYAYSGWNAAADITGEIERPEKNVPRSLICGTMIVLVLYAGLNAVFLLTTPMGEMSGQVEVALIAGRHIFGETGGKVVGGMICLGLISAVSSMTWIGPRVMMSMGEDHRFLRAFARKTSGGVPNVAMLFQLFVVNLLLLTRSFEEVVVYIQFSLLLCSLLTVLGLIVLRIKSPQLARPYRVRAYPLPPLLFSGVTIWMMIYLLRSHPTESLFGLGTMFVGLMLYFVGNISARRPV
jgi:APA family basic amino acid/polyamine antiporter